MNALVGRAGMLMGLLASGPAWAACTYQGDPVAFVLCINGELQVLQAKVSTLQGVIAAQNAYISQLRPVLAVSGSEVIFEGVNVHVRDGSGTTAGGTSGLGNVIVGYNEADVGDDRSGVHNVVVGPLHAYAGHSGVIAGTNHDVSGAGASAIGGTDNTASGDGAMIGGGEFNFALGEKSHISGGYNNIVSADRGIVVGGAINEVGGPGGGVVVGGLGNFVTGSNAVVVGGDSNLAQDEVSVAVGGITNVTTGRASIVP